MSLFQAEEIDGYKRMGKVEPILRGHTYTCPECEFKYFGVRRYAYHLVKVHNLKPSSFTNEHGVYYADPESLKALAGSSVEEQESSDG